MAKSTKAAAEYERQIFTLPRPLVAELTKYAAICRRGNKSGFVADAVAAYIKSLRRYRRTQKLRESYAAVAQHGLEIDQQWRQLDDEAWAKLDQLESGA